MDLLGVSPWATFNKQLLDEVFLVSRIIKASVRVIVLLYIERILSFSLRHKMFSKFVPTLSFPQVPSVFFLIHVISKQLLCHLRRPFCVL